MGCFWISAVKAVINARAYEPRPEVLTDPRPSIIAGCPSHVFLHWVPMLFASWRYPGYIPAMSMTVCSVCPLRATMSVRGVPFCTADGLVYIAKLQGVQEGYGDPKEAEVA